jgi:hypothetical protein
MEFFFNAGRGDPGAIWDILTRRIYYTIPLFHDQRPIYLGPSYLYNAASWKYKIFWELSVYTYPLKLEFPVVSIGRHVDVKNGDGRFIMRAKDPFIAVKDLVSVEDGNGKPVFEFSGDGLRLLFHFGSMSSHWDIRTPDGNPLVYLQSYWARMEEFQSVYVEGPSATDGNGMPSFGGIAGSMAASFVNEQARRATPGRLVYKIMDQKISDKILGWVVPTRGTAWFDFLPYRTRIQILNIPFMSRAYAPSYEFKFGDLYGPTTLKLRKERDLIVDRYVVEKVGELTDAQERWVVPVLTLVTMLERFSLKQMTDW